MKMLAKTRGIEVAVREIKRRGEQQIERAGDRNAESAFRIEADAKYLCPVRYGFLRSSIQAEIVHRLLAYVRVYESYGPHVEYGTWKMAAQPFITPAVEAERERMRGWR